MNFKSILSKLGQDIGIGPVSLDDRESCYLRFNQHTLVIEHIKNQELLYIYTAISEPKDVKREDYLEHLLTANHFGQGTGNAAFSFNPNTQETFLSTKISDKALDYDSFVLTLEQFLFSIDKAYEFLAELKNEKTAPLHQDMHLKNPFA